MDQTDKSIHTLAQEIKEQIRQDTLAASRVLIDFAKKYARNKQLHREALLLKLDYANSDEESEQEHIITEMLVLVNNVVKDYLNNPKSDAIETRKYEARKRSQIDATIEAIRPQAELIFEGMQMGRHFVRSNFRLQGVDLKLRAGEITGVVGENGNGKTTLFRIIVGDLQASEGQIRYPGLGEPEWNHIRWTEVKNQIAYIPQELPKWYGSLRNNIHLAATLHGIEGRANEEAVNYILHRLSLVAHADKKWSELSGGYKLRFALARALVWKPKILVIDEPLANLDVNAQSVVLNDLRYLASSWRHPIAILISSQHLHELESVANNILFLREGKVIYNGRIKEFGRERVENSFELECALNLKELERRLQGLDYNTIDYDGLRFVIHTPLQIKQKDLLQKLLENKVEISYFRNISQSTKKLFV